jgi:hypothetical protein
MAAPTFAVAGTEDIAAGTPRTPGVPAGLTASRSMVLGFMVTLSNVNPAAGTGFTKKYSSADVDAGTPSIYVQWKRADNPIETGTYSWATGSAVVVSQAVAWRVENELSSGDPFFSSVFIDRTTAVTAIPAANLTSVPAHSTLVWIGATGASRTLTNPPTGFTRLSPNTAHGMHIAVLEDYAGGSPSTATAAFTGGSVSSTVLLMAILPTSVGTVSGAWDFAGSATGEAPPDGASTGTISGSWNFAGSASGVKNVAGTASGGWNFFGTAQGSVGVVEHVEDWADLADVNDTGVQVSGNKLYASGSSTPRGFTRDFDFPTSGLWRLQTLIYNVDGGSPAPEVKFGITCATAGTGVAQNPADGLGIQIRFSTRDRTSYKGSGLSAVAIVDEASFGANATANCTYLATIDADPVWISFTLKQVGVVGDLFTFKVSREDLADAGKTITQVWGYITDARTTSGMSMSPWIYQSGSLEPTATKTVGGQLIEGATDRIIHTGQSVASPMDWFISVPPGYAGVDTPIVIFCPQSVTGDGHDPWSDDRMWPVTEALSDAGYILASSSDTVDRFGNQVELDNYSALWNWVYAHLRPAEDDTFLLGASMGTVPVINIIGRNVLTIRAAAEIGFAGGFDWLWDVSGGAKRDDIRAAYDFTDEADLFTATAGYDPLLSFLTGTPFVDIGFRFYTSTGDTITPDDLSIDMAAIVAADGSTEEDLVYGTGGHLDPSQYDGDDLVAFYQRNATNVPAEGTASGSWTFAGSASGQKHPEGTASGSWTFAGTASGLTDREGIATGGFNFAGTASGDTPHEGTATGSHAWAGGATGETHPEGSTTGGWQFAGTASGSADREGTAAGSWNFAGVADGTNGEGNRATGAWNFAGTATGAADYQGSVSGGYNYTGSASGGASASGTAAGTYSFAGNATGTRHPDGTAAGSHGWAGTATGSVDREGAATGTFNWSGAVAGTTSRSGTASGTHTWVGAAHGSDPSIPKRETIVVAMTDVSRVTTTTGRFRSTVIQEAR